MGKILLYLRNRKEFELPGVGMEDELEAGQE